MKKTTAKKRQNNTLYVSELKAILSNQPFVQRVSPNDVSLPTQLTEGLG